MNRDRAHFRFIDLALLNVLVVRHLLVCVMRSPFGWRSGCLGSMGGPAGTHLSSLLNAAYSRLRRVRGGYVSSPRRASANPHPLMSDGCLDTPSGPPGASGGLRCRDGLAPRLGVSCGAIGLRTRMTRLCAGDEYINTAHRHIPAFLACDVTRATPVTRPLPRLDTVRPLAGSFPGSRAVLL